MRLTRSTQPNPEDSHFVKPCQCSGCSELLDVYGIGIYQVNLNDEQPAS